nr:hypothetical protein [Clostridioides difficile]
MIRKIPQAELKVMKFIWKVDATVTSKDVIEVWNKNMVETNHTLHFYLGCKKRILRCSKNRQIYTLHNKSKTQRLFKF